MKCFAAMIISTKIVLIAAVLSACASQQTIPTANLTPPPNQEKLKLTVSYSRDDITWSLVMDDLCNKFESENPDIDLEIQDTGSLLYEENLKVKEALNEFPDILEIENLDDYVNNNRLGVIPPSVSSLIEEPAFINGEVYTVPLYTTTYGILYNQVLFKKYNLQPPQTYEEFLQICQTLHSHGVVPLTFGGTKEDSITYWLNYFHPTKAESNETVDQPLRFSDPDYLDMLGNYQELMNSPYVLKDSIYMNDSQIINFFLNQQVAMYFTKPSFIANILQVDPDCMSSLKDNMGMEIEDDRLVRLAWFFVPQEDSDIIATKEIGSQLAISKECSGDPRRLQAAERFLTFLLEDTNYRDILKSMYGYQTTSKRVLYPAPSVQQYLIVDYRYAKKAKSFRDATHMPGAFKRELNKTLFLLLGNSMTVEEAAAYLDSRWQELNEQE